MSSCQAASTCFTIEAVPGGAEHPDGTGPIQHPRRQDKVRQPRRVVGVEVSEEDVVQPGRIEGGYSLIPGGGSSAHDPRAGVHQIRLLAHDDGEGRTRPLRVGVGRPSAQNDDAGGGWNELLGRVVALAGDQRAGNARGSDGRPGGQGTKSSRDRHEGWRHSGPRPVAPQARRGQCSRPEPPSYGISQSPRNYHAEPEPAPPVHAIADGRNYRTSAGLAGGPPAGRRRAAGRRLGSSSGRGVHRARRPGDDRTVLHHAAGGPPAVQRDGFPRRWITWAASPGRPTS